MKHFFYAFFLVLTLVIVSPVHAQESSVTQTPIPSGPTTLSVTVFLHGIGKAGDSVNHAPSGTTRPLHTERTITVTFYDLQKNLIATKQGTVVYDEASGSFKGGIALDTDCPSGTYRVEINTDRYIKQMLPGEQLITVGTTNTLPAVSLVAGDVSNDEYLDIVDYSMMIGCFSELMPAASCDGATKDITDITDDGVVNQFDYNLFLRELTKQSGR